MPNSAAQRAEAVRRVRDVGEPVGQVAAMLSVHPSTVRRWLRDAAPPTAPADATSNPAVPPRMRPREPEPKTGPEPTVEPVDPGDTAVPGDSIATGTTGRLWFASAAVLVGLALSVALSTLGPPPAGIYQAAVAVHLICLTAGFGAVLLVDWHGLFWLAGRRELTECRRVADAAGPVIWAAFAGLIVSGGLLAPDVGSGLTWVKFAAVALIGLNAVWISRLSPALAALAALAGQGRQAAVRSKPMRRLLANVTLSQAGWWTATAVGLITDAKRR